MTTSSNLVTEPKSKVTVPVSSSFARRTHWLARRLFWSMRRELWENRSISVGPPAVAAVFLVGFVVYLAGLTEAYSAAAALGPMQQRAAIEQPYVVAALVLMVVGLVVAVIYSVDALYGERRDRSILFWRSLPVSDVTTVLAKASVPVLVIPLVTFVVTVVTQLTMLLTSSVVLMASDMSAESLWSHVPFFQTSMTNLVHLLGYHGLWYAPLWGWLLMVSAWAKRAPFLWAVLPPIAIGVVERIAFNTSHFASMLHDRFLGSSDAAGPDGRLSMDMLASQPVGPFLASPELWAGLVLTAIFLSAAVRFHRAQGPN